MRALSMAERCELFGCEVVEEAHAIVVGPVVELPMTPERCRYAEYLRVECLCLELEKKLAQEEFKKQEAARVAEASEYW